MAFLSQQRFSETAYMPSSAISAWWSGRPMKSNLHNRVGKKNKTAEQCQVDIELPAQAVCQGYGRQDAEPGGKERPAEENGVAQVAEMQNGMAFTAQRMSIGRVQCRISPNG